MKITFIISSLSSGGAERVLSNLANALSKKHNIKIITFSSEDSFYDLSQNIEHIKLNLMEESKNIFISLYNTLKRIKTLKQTLKSINADINISFVLHTNLLATIASRLNKQKIIISERTVYDFYDSIVLNILKKIIYPKAAFLITQTLNDKKNYTFMKNVKVIYNPLGLVPRKYKKEKIILAVGRLDRNKGFHDLLKAFSKVKADEWKLCIVGDGIEKESLLSLKKELNLKDVEFIGNRKDIFEWYAKSSIFVLSSKKEGFPNVLLEAMGSGCACVSFDCPNGPAEIIQNGKNGILVENQNIEKLIQAIQKLIDDNQLREQCSNEAIKVIKTYHINKIAHQWEELIQRVITDD